MEYGFERERIGYTFAHLDEDEFRAQAMALGAKVRYEEQTLLWCGDCEKWHSQPHAKGVPLSLANKPWREVTAV